LAKEVFLIDGHSLIYRSYYAFIRNPLRNSKGENTSAVFGFVNTLKKLLEKYKPEFGAIAYDTGGETFRHREFKEYKITRPETPDELRPQIPIIKQVGEAYGLSSFEIEGYEADDVLASLAKTLSEKDYKVYIVTSDKDLLQLVSPKILIYDPWKELIYDQALVKERFGVGPEKIADILALAGDKIDNIPGVPGIGDKRAREIILKYGSLEQAIEYDERVKPHKEKAILSKNLALLKGDLKLPVDETKLRIKEKDEGTLLKIFKEMEFSSFLKDLTFQKPTNLVVQELMDKKMLVQKNEFSFYFDEQEGLLLATDEETIQRIPIDQKNLIKEILGNNKFLKIGFDIKAQLHKLARYAIDLSPPIYDLMVGAWLLDSNRKQYTFNDLLIRHLGIAAKEPRPIDRSFYSYAIYKKIGPEITARNLDPILKDLEMPLLYELAAMERRGVKIDVKFFKHLNQELKEELNLIERDIHQLAKIDFNINSPKQLSYVLFEKLKLPTKRRTKTGHSTDYSTLQELKAAHPIVPKIIRHRELSKLIFTYLEPMLELCDPKTQRIYTSFNQTGTATGRLSCSRPNLQNIPMRGELGKRIRKGFIAEDGYLLISADYSQIELRILAHITGDERLKEAFAQGEDIHTKTACAILNLKPDEVTEEHRRIAKAVNYGLIYGLSDYGLASGLGIPIEQAQAFIEEYLGSYPKVAEWREKIIAQAKADGYVKTILGRIRPLPELFSPNRAVNEGAKRAAINTPIQGSAADIIKKAMVLLANSLKEEGFLGGMIIQIHDELVFEIEETKGKRATDLIRAVMSEPLKLDVPLAVSIGVGKNWAEAH
jgi:DNA polymerase-1